MNDTPLTASDLHEIAKRLQQWERRLVDKNGDWKDASNLVARIEVHRPDDERDIVGHFVLEDGGWVGFMPRGFNR